MGSDSTAKLPTWFIGHGGVSILFKPGYDGVKAHLREIGKEMKSLKPSAIVLTCGHFQSDQPDVIQVNVKEPTKVWHDFGVGWLTTSPHVFQYGYPHKSSKALAEKVIAHLQSKGIKAEGVERDLDHGVWVPFKLMFPEGEDELDVPILEISTYAGQDLDAHIKLGEALSSIGDNILLVGSGMLVHNLQATREMKVDKTVPRLWESAAREALVAQTIEERNAQFKALVKRSDYLDAHPTPDHLLPLYMTLGVGHDLKSFKVYNSDRYIVGQSYFGFRLGNLPGQERGYGF